MILKHITGAMITIFLITGFAGAKELTMPAGRWWNNTAIAEKINLSKDEISQLDAAFNTSYRNMIELKSAVEKERFELEVLLEQENIDEKAVIAQYKKTDLARSAVSESRFLLLLEVRKVIGYDRFKQLKRFYERTRKGNKSGAKKNQNSTDNKKTS